MSSGTRLGARRSDIGEALKGMPRRTLQCWLKRLVGQGVLTQESKGPAARYRLPAAAEEHKETSTGQEGTDLEGVRVRSASAH